MTYIVGWKNKTSSFIVSDSILTYENKKPIITNSISTFKEKLLDQPGDYQIEGCNKIFNFRDKLLIGFATDYVLDVVLMLEHIEDNLDYDNIKESLLNILPDKCPDNTCLIIAFIEDNKPILGRYNKDFNEIEDDDMAIQIGSGTDAKAFSDLSDKICSDLEINNKKSDDELLLISVSTHQHLIVKHELIQIGAGGIITGARISKEGVSWQPSTSYVQYSIDKKESDKGRFKEIGLIHLSYFTDVMTYFSSYIDVTALTRNFLVRCDPQKGESKTISKRAQYRLDNIDTKKSDEFYNCPNTEYIIFFSNQKDLKSKIFIIKNDGEQNFANITCLDKEGYYNVEISKEFLEVIQEESEMDNIEYVFMN